METRILKLRVEVENPPIRVPKVRVAAGNVPAEVGNLLIDLQHVLVNVAKRASTPGTSPGDLADVRAEVRYAVAGVANLPGDHFSGHRQTASKAH